MRSIENYSPLSTKFTTNSNLKHELKSGPALKNQVAHPRPQAQGSFAEHGTLLMIALSL